HKIEQVDDSTKKLHNSFTKEINTFKRTFLLMLGLSLLFLFLVFLVEIVLVKKRIVRPITHMSEVAKRIHQGEFNVRCVINTEDELEELANSINDMVDRIVFLIRSDADRQRMQEDILVLLETVSQASKGDLTVRGQVVTEELQAVNDAFNHMMTSIGALVIKVRKSGMGLESTTRMLLESLKVILEKATTQASNLDIASRKIKALGDRSQEITRMVEQIGNIAMETRTLALNATLEASRAGERDTGISHLAEHVRQLAEGLEKTKQDIESFIGSIQLATNYAVDSVQDVLQLTRNTRDEAESACNTAEVTYGEAEELGKSIALFRVKTPKDKEREVQLKGGLVNVIGGVKNIRALVNSMDTKEFDSLNVILDDFEKDLDTFGFDEYQILLESRSEAREDEIPAILPGTQEE
ncbi:methyl-accepting chemotaxis protein, partial [Myxococcota bacterium]|nr:methyl-accepting chemotaxis protein [Myxococcota bacterium]